MSESESNHSSESDKPRRKKRYKTYIEKDSKTQTVPYSTVLYQRYFATTADSGASTSHGNSGPGNGSEANIIPSCHAAASSQFSSNHGSPVGRPQDPGGDSIHGDTSSGSTRFGNSPDGSDHRHSNTDGSDIGDSDIGDSDIGDSDDSGGDTPSDGDSQPGDPLPDDPQPGDPQPDNPDDYGLDDLLPNSGKTKFEILVMVIHYMNRFELSDVATEALLKLVNEIVGEDIIPPSKHIFKKIFSSGKGTNTFLYCSECLVFLGKKEDCDMEECIAPNCNAPVEVESLNKGHYFMDISIADQIRERLEAPNGEDLLSYRQNREVDHEEIRDVFDGMVFEELNRKISESEPPNQSFVTLTMSADGAQSAKNSYAAVWPVQFIINEIGLKERFAPYNVLLAGVWFGQSDISLVTYLTFLIDQLQELATEGVSWFRASLQRQEVTKVYCLNFLADTIAKAKLLNMIQFNGYESCYFCFLRGDPLPNSTQIRFPYQAVYPERSEESLKAHMEEAEATPGLLVHGMKGVSPTCYFPLFSLPWGVPIDYLHSHLIGITKYLCVSIWMNSEHSDAPFYLDNAKVQIIDKRIAKIHAPSDISRDLRPLSSCALWKGNEWRQWLFFDGPICLQGILPQRYYRHFCRLSAALYFFNKSRIKRRQIEFYKGLLSDFVEEFEELYGLSHMTYNLHLTVHISQCVVSNGPLFAYSLFCHETGNRYTLKLVKGARGVVKQIIRRYCIYSSIPCVVSRHPPLSQSVVDFCDSVLSLRRFKTVERGANEVVIVGNKFSKRFVPSVEEANAMIAKLPGIDPHRLYLLKKLIFKGSTFTPVSLKDKKKDDSFVKLTDGKILNVRKFFISSLDYNKVYILGKELQLQGSGMAVFNLQDFHVKICQPYPYEGGFTIVPAAMIEEKCFFMTVQGSSYVALFPNRYERD